MAHDRYGHQGCEEEDPGPAVGHALGLREEQHAAPDEHHPTGEADSGVDGLPREVVPTRVPAGQGVLSRSVDEQVRHGRQPITGQTRVPAGQCAIPRPHNCGAGRSPSAYFQALTDYREGYVESIIRQFHQRLVPCDRQRPGSCRRPGAGLRRVEREPCLQAVGRRHDACSRICCTGLRSTSPTSKPPRASPCLRPNVPSSKSRKPASSNVRAAGSATGRGSPKTSLTRSTPSRNASGVGVRHS